MKHLSASRIGLCSDCSLRYKFQYVDKIVKPAVSIHLTFGSAIHKALEDLNKSLKEKIIDIEDFFQSFHDEYENDCKKMGLENDYLKNKLYLMGINNLEKYYNEFLDYEIIAIEKEFRVPIVYPNGETCKTHELYGFIDSIIKRKNMIGIVDYKTAKEQYPKFKIDTSVQLAIYSYAFRIMLSNGEFPNIKKNKEDYISYYLFIKDYSDFFGNIKIQRKKISTLEINKMLYVCDMTIKTEDSGIFLPNYNSTCKWCDYKKECLNFEPTYTSKSK